MLEITQTIKKIMELDRYICDRCGKSHEVCKCIDLEQDLFILAQLEEFDSLEEDDYFVNENTYPKISTHNVEVLEGIFVSRDYYELHWK